MSNGYLGLGALAAMMSRSFAGGGSDAYGAGLSSPKNSGVRARIAQIIGLLQQGGLTTQDQDRLLRELSELQAKLAGEQEADYYRARLAANMPGAPGQTRPGGGFR